MASGANKPGKAYAGGNALGGCGFGLCFLSLVHWVTLGQWCKAHSSSPTMSTWRWDCCHGTVGTYFLEESGSVGSRGYGWVLQYFLTVSHAPFEGYKGKLSGYWWNHQVNCLSLCLGKHTTYFFPKMMECLGDCSLAVKRYQHHTNS